VKFAATFFERHDVFRQHREPAEGQRRSRG
jgi:hypothetical protein